MQMRRTAIVEEDVETILRACVQELHALSGKTLLLTGGSGFVGSYLVESIIAFNAKHDGAPCQLLLPTRSLEAIRLKWPHFCGVPNIIWFEWDGRCLCLPDDSKCDYVIHAASPADPARFIDTPMDAMEDIALGTSAVLHYARSSDVITLLYLSSGAVYGQQSHEIEALYEDDRGAPALTELSSCYGEGKRYAELLCRASGVPTVIARLFTFIGPYQDINGSFAAPEFIRQALYDNKIVIKSDGSAMRTYCYATDLAIALWKLLIHGMHGDIYNVGADDPQVSIRELAEAIAAQFTDVEVVVEGAASPGPRSHYLPNTDKLNKLHRSQIGLAEGLHRTITALRSSLV